MHHYTILQSRAPTPRRQELTKSRRGSFWFPGERTEGEPFRPWEGLGTLPGLAWRLPRRNRAVPSSGSKSRPAWTGGSLCFGRTRVRFFFAFLPTTGPVGSSSRPAAASHCPASGPFGSLTGIPVVVFLFCSQPAIPRGYLAAAGFLLAFSCLRIGLSILIFPGKRYSVFYYATQSTLEITLRDL